MQPFAPFLVALGVATLSLLPSNLVASSPARTSPPPAVTRAVAQAPAPALAGPELKKSHKARFELKKEVKKATERWLADEARHVNQPADIDAIIEREARANGVDPLLVATIVKFESGGDPHAESWVGAQGLMQMMPETAAEMGVQDPTDPEQNIAGGARYFGQMMEAFGDPRLALAAYNAGPGAVQEYGGVPPYEETRHYVQNIYGEYARRSWERGQTPTGFSS